MSNFLTLDWQGKQYELNLDKVTSRQWDQVEIHTRLIDDDGVLVEPGLTAGEILGVVAFGAGRGVSGRMGRGLLWLFKAQAGDAAAFEDDIPLLEFYAALGRAVDDAATAATAAVKADEAAPKEGSTPSSPSDSSESASNSDS